MQHWKDTFVHHGKSLPYNRIEYNNIAERAVEIPIAFDYLARVLARAADKPKVLEIGNVLANYENVLSDFVGIRPRRIIDKFEVAPGVDNVDLMDLPSDEKYRLIVCLSTVEHVGQGYGGNAESHEPEAPLKAIAKIYDLLELGGKALITVPFGRLLDGGWYIQFSAEYLQLLSTCYGIPEGAIAASFMKRLATDINQNNPAQLWVQATAAEMADVDYGWLFPYGNGLGVIELTKLSYDFELNLAVEPTPLTYHQPILSTLNAELLQATYACLEAMRDINLIVFPDWQQPEAVLQQELGPVLRAIMTHPNRAQMTLFVSAPSGVEEDATLAVSGLVMEILTDAGLEIDDEPEIYFLTDLAPIQWQAILPRMQFKVSLGSDDQEAIAQAQASDLPTCSSDTLPTLQAVQADTGVWQFIPGSTSAMPI